jgi:hypothetical protein
LPDIKSENLIEGSSWPGYDTKIIIRSIDGTNFFVSKELGSKFRSTSYKVALDDLITLYRDLVSRCFGYPKQPPVIHTLLSNSGSFLTPTTYYSLCVDFASTTGFETFRAIMDPLIAAEPVGRVDDYFISGFYVFDEYAKAVFDGLTLCFNRLPDPDIYDQFFRFYSQFGHFKVRNTPYTAAQDVLKGFCWTNADSWALHTIMLEYPGYTSRLVEDALTIARGFVPSAIETDITEINTLRFFGVNANTFSFKSVEANKLFSLSVGISEKLSQYIRLLKVYKLADIYFSPGNIGSGVELLNCIICSIFLPYPPDSVPMRRIYAAILYHLNGATLVGNRRYGMVDGCSTYYDALAIVDAAEAAANGNVPNFLAAVDQLMGQLPNNVRGSILEVNRMQRFADSNMPVIGGNFSFNPNTYLTINVANMQAAMDPILGLDSNAVQSLKINTNSVRDVCEYINSRLHVMSFYAIEPDNPTAYRYQLPFDVAYCSSFLLSQLDFTDSSYLNYCTKLDNLLAFSNYLGKLHFELTMYNVLYAVTAALPVVTSVEKDSRSYFRKVILSAFSANTGLEDKKALENFLVANANAVAASPWVCITLANALALIPRATISYQHDVTVNILAHPTNLSSITNVATPNGLDEIERSSVSNALINNADNDFRFRVSNPRFRQSKIITGIGLTFEDTKTILSDPEFTVLYSDSVTMYGSNSSVRSSFSASLDGCFSDATTFLADNNLTGRFQFVNDRCVVSNSAFFEVELNS